MISWLNNANRYTYKLIANLLMLGAGVLAILSHDNGWSLLTLIPLLMVGGALLVVYPVYWRRWRRGD